MSTNVKCGERVLEGILRGSGFRISGLGTGSEGLVQQFQLQFQRKLSRVYDLTSPSFYYLEGPSEGNVALTRVVGPKGTPKLACDCTPRTIILDASQAACYPANTPGADSAYTLSNAMPFGLQGQGSVDNFLVVFSISYMFNNLE